MAKIITSIEDCADCLCRVCAKNADNDSHNPELNIKDCAPCHYCKIGESEIVDTEDDCFKHEFYSDVSLL